MQSRRTGFGKQDLLLDLMLTQLREGQQTEALQTYQDYLQYCQTHKLAVPKVLADLPAWLLKRTESNRYALLVGVNDAFTSKADVDIQNWATCLENHMGFVPGNITRLEGADASREAILKAFGKLVAQSRRFPTLFVYAGTGTVRSAEPPICGIAAYDSELEKGADAKEISLQDLADLTENTRNMSVVLDAGWALKDERSTGIANYFDRQRNRPLPPIGTSMLVSAWELDNALQLTCLEDENGSHFSQQLIRQIMDLPYPASIQTYVQSMKDQAFSLERTDS